MIGACGPYYLGGYATEANLTVKPKGKKYLSKKRNYIYIILTIYLE
jgi:hypothetical protein